MGEKDGKHIYIGTSMIKGESSVDRRLGPLVLCFLQMSFYWYLSS